MKVLIVVLIAFLAAVYVFTFIKWKKRRNQGVNAVADFREKYLRDKTVTDEEATSKDSKPIITKYNSQIDYMERDEFIKETSEQKPKKHYKYIE